MNVFSALYQTNPLICFTAPAVPPEVQRFANQLDAQTQQLLASVAVKELFVTALITAVFSLFCSLLLVLFYPLAKVATQPVPVSRFVPKHRSRHPVISRTARANGGELRSLSARLRAGQLNN